MQSLNLSKTFRIGLVATAIATCSAILPVAAQVSPDNTTPGSPGTTTDTTDVRDYDNDTDWGWLGLLGLIGLAGLRRKPEDNVYRRDTDPTTTTRTDYHR
jgi:MYXO-CTERM domain-containing protein